MTLSTNPVHGRERRAYQRFKHDPRGIEGLPLRLLIIVIITVVALSIIMVWLSGIGTVKELKKIECSPEDIDIPSGSNNITLDITIKVFDNQNNKVSGVIVTLSGCGVTTSGKTDGSGSVTFTNLDVRLPSETPTGIIEVKAQKTDYRSTDTTIHVY